MALALLWLPGRGHAAGPTPEPEAPPSQPELYPDGVAPPAPPSLYPEAEGSRFERTGRLGRDSTGHQVVHLDGGDEGASPVYVIDTARAGLHALSVQGELHDGNRVRVVYEVRGGQRLAVAVEPR